MAQTTEQTKPEEGPPQPAGWARAVVNPEQYERAVFVDRDGVRRPCLILRKYVAIKDTGVPVSPGSDITGKEEQPRADVVVRYLRAGNKPEYISHRATPLWKPAPGERIMHVESR